MKISHFSIVAAVLVILTNAAALGGVAYNRSGEPESELLLSQRELGVPPWRRAEADNSGITLTLDWRVIADQFEPDFVGFAYLPRWGVPGWLDQGKLAQLGFDMSRPVTAPDAGRHYEKMMSREVLLVLEFDGSAYQQELEHAREFARKEAALLAANPDGKEFVDRAKRARELLEKEERDFSRLFVIDAGLELQQLRAAYPDRSRYAIVHGQIRPVLRQEKNRTWLSGSISHLAAQQINVPAGDRKIFEASRYEVAVAFGRRLEPWITAASATAQVK